MIMMYQDYSIKEDELLHEPAYWNMETSMTMYPMNTANQAYHPLEACSPPVQDWEANFYDYGTSLCLVNHKSTEEGMMVLPLSPTDAFTSCTSSPVADQWMDPYGANSCMSSPMLKIETVDLLPYPASSTSPLDYPYQPLPTPHASPSAYPPSMATFTMMPPPSPTTTAEEWAYPTTPARTRAYSTTATSCSSSSLATLSPADQSPHPMSVSPVVTRPRSASESHAGQRPYKCTTCYRSFARKHDLQRHVRVHTGEKPYPCLCCKKSFARTDALKRHLRMEEACRLSPEVQAMKGAGKRRYRDI